MSKTDPLNPKRLDFAIQSVLALYQFQKKTAVKFIFCRKLISRINPMVQSCSPLWNFLLIMAGSLASVSVHIMLKKTLLVPLSNWNLIFWRGLFQMLLSVVFILKNRKRGISTFPVSKYHLISVSNIAFTSCEQPILRNTNFCLFTF